MLAKKDPYIKEAYDELQKISADEIKTMEYIQREKAILDELALKRESLEEGREEGKLEERREIAKKLLDILDIKTIDDKTGLSIEEIENL